MKTLLIALLIVGFLTFQLLSAGKEPSSDSQSTVEELSSGSLESSLRKSLLKPCEPEYLQACPDAETVDDIVICLEEIAVSDQCAIALQRM